MNTENSKTNESRRFKLDLADKLNLQNPKKKHGFSQSITPRKTLNLNTTTMHLKYLLQLGMKLLIYLLVLILLLIFKIILHLS